MDFGLRTLDYGLMLCGYFFSWEITMARKKIGLSEIGQQEVEYTKTNLFPCPYLNLVYAILQRELDDLVLDIPYKIPSWDRVRRSRYLYLQMARSRAFSFFFDERSQHFKDFLYWCDMGGFNYKQWQNRALLAVAQHVLDDPLFFERVVKNLVSRETSLRVSDVVSSLLKNINVH